jgi:hypothetical protein
VYDGNAVVSSANLLNNSITDTRAGELD